MGLEEVEHDGEDVERVAEPAEMLAEESGLPESEFRYDGQIPDVSDQELKPIDE